MGREGSIRVTFRGLLAGVGAVLVAAVCIRLGFWQLGRLEERRERNAALSAAMALPPADLTPALIDSLRGAPDRYRYRSVRAPGSFQAGESFLLRGQAHRGQPGVHLIAPLQLDEGSVLLVDLGWLPAPDAATANPRPHLRSGAASVEGVLLPLSADSAAETPLEVEVEGRAVRTVRRLHRGLATGREPLPLYLQRLPDPAAPGALPRAQPRPTLDEGPHLGYAIQWFSFAAIALIGFATVALRAHSRA